MGCVNSRTNYDQNGDYCENARNGKHLEQIGGGTKSKKIHGTQNGAVAMDDKNDKKRCKRPKKGSTNNNFCTAAKQQTNYYSAVQANIIVTDGFGCSADPTRAKRSKRKGRKSKDHSDFEIANLTGADDNRIVGSKLAFANEDPSTSPTISNGVSLLSRKSAQNGLVPPQKLSKTNANVNINNNNHNFNDDDGSHSQLTSDALYRNFQNRLVNAHVSKCNRLTSSQMDFFRLLDEKIEQGKDYGSGS